MSTFCDGDAYMVSEFEREERATEFIKSNRCLREQYFTSSGPGVILVSLSCLLTRAKVTDDFDYESPSNGQKKSLAPKQLIGEDDYSCQELVNLLLTGRAKSNLFNFSQCIDVDYDISSSQRPGIYLKGVDKANELGFLSVAEADGFVSIGSFLKHPISPIWVVWSGNHYTTILSINFPEVKVCSGFTRSMYYVHLDQLQSTSDMSLFRFLVKNGKVFSSRENASTKLRESNFERLELLQKIFDTRRDKETPHLSPKSATILPDLTAEVVLQTKMTAEEDKKDQDFSVTKETPAEPPKASEPEENSSKVLPDIPKEFPFENVDVDAAWNEYFDAFLLLYGKDTALLKTQNPKFPRDLYNKVPQLKLDQKTDDADLKLVFKILRTLCLFLCVKRAEPEQEFAFYILTLAEHFGKNTVSPSIHAQIQEYSIKSINNLFFTDKTMQQTLGKKFLAKFLQLFNRGRIWEANLSNFFLVTMLVVTNNPNLKNIDKNVILPFVKEMIVSICVAFPEDKNLISSGLKLLYGLGFSNDDLLKELYEYNETNHPVSQEEIAQILSELSLVDDKVPVLDRLGFLLIRIFLDEDKEMIGLQKQATTILLQTEKLPEKERFIEFLVQKGVIGRIVVLLEKEVIPMENFYDRKMDLISFLAVLTKFCEASEQAKIVIEEKLFPYTLSEPDYSGLSEAEAKKVRNKRHMEGNTPDNVLGRRIIELMTDFDQNVKRLAAELVWAICDGDKNRFIVRAGYGNGVHLMAIKGGLMEQMMKNQRQ
eukprot:augustus_masked-scaffold_89-processed-gene-0.5-mRNA-1 protein AED:1.00 eAED:1.00 QI:0/0/0/0/1/1/3/0/766